MFIVLHPVLNSSTTERARKALPVFVIGKLAKDDEFIFQE
jgi:hypothetical protein